MPPVPETPGALRLADLADRFIGRLCQVIVVVTLGVLLVMLTLNILARYLLHQGGIAWISELPEQLFPWLIAAGIVLAARGGAHIAVDFAITHTRPLLSRAVALGVHLLIVACYVTLLIVVLRVAGIAALERSPLLGLPRSYGYFALAFACIGTALESAIIFVRVWYHGLGALPQGQVEDSPL